MIKKGSRGKETGNLVIEKGSQEKEIGNLVIGKLSLRKEIRSLVKGKESQGKEIGNLVIETEIEKEVNLSPEDDLLVVGKNQVTKELHERGREVEMEESKEKKRGPDLFIEEDRGRSREGGLHPTNDLHQDLQGDGHVRKSLLKLSNLLKHCCQEPKR